MEILADLSEGLYFRARIASLVHLVELTVPLEGNFMFANKRTRTRYEPVRANCENRGWSCSVIPVEVGCRGFIA